MNATMQKWGNSLAVRIPKIIAEEIQMSEGSTVEMKLEGGALVLRPARPKYSLAELLASVTPEDSHQEMDWGKAEGREVW